MANPTKIKNKDQFVVAFLPDFEWADTVVSHALFLSKMIDKGLILLHICDPKYTQTDPEKAEQKLLEIKAAHKGEAELFHCVLNGDTKNIINTLPTALNAVVAVCAVNPNAHHNDLLHKRKVLRFFSECKIAYLTVQEPLSNPGLYKNVLTTIDFKKESKEKLIWTSYFARFNGSQIHVLYYDYKDEGLKQKWYDNMRFLHKFFTNLNLSFLPHIIPSNHSTFTDINALKELEIQQKESGYNEGKSVPWGVMLSVTTQEKDALEWFYGTQEQRSIVNNLKMPILYLNPRNDLYVLCD